jgi:hypothetical protein
MSPASDITTIKVKSPEMLATVIAWIQGDFFPDAKSLASAAGAELQRTPSDLVDTVDFKKLDDDNLWSDV